MTRANNSLKRNLNPEDLFNDSDKEVEKTKVKPIPTATNGSGGNTYDLSSLRVSGSSGPLKPGVYEGIIREVNVKKMEDHYSEDDELKDVFVFDLELWNDDGKEVYPKFFANASLHQKSKLVKTLENLEVDYLTDKLDLSIFSNMSIKARVRINQSKPGYNKVIEIWKG